MLAQMDTRATDPSLTLIWMALGSAASQSGQPPAQMTTSLAPPCPNSLAHQLISLVPTRKPSKINSIPEHWFQVVPAERQGN